jgi:iron complex transport system permease protein
VSRPVLAVLALGLVGLAISPLLGPYLDGPSAAFVLQELRLPRAVLGGLVGAALAASGAAYQTVLENPLATPSTMGTTAGAALGALAVLVLGPVGVGALGVGLGAFVGAAGVSLGVAALAAQHRLRTEELLLAGVAIMLGAGAATTGLQLQADAAATLASVRWSLGSLSVVGWERPLGLLPVVAVGLGLLAVHGQALQTLVAGADRAATQGVDVVRVRTTVLLTGSLLVAACVALTGPIAFVGLVVPHLVRRLGVGGGPRRLVPLAAVAGAGFLPLADGLSRALLPSRDLPVGVVMAMLGAPVLLALLLGRRR